MMWLSLGSDAVETKVFGLIANAAAVIHHEFGFSVKFIDVHHQACICRVHTWIGVLLCLDQGPGRGSALRLAF